MSSLTDQQLRSELLSFGEEVPPITNRNRADLIARLERLREKGKRPTRSSPSRARTSTAPTASRSRVVPGLIELSDSDTDAPSNYSSNSTRSSQRSIPVPQSSSIATEVEQSIARHRREIEQMISAARERALAVNSSLSPKATNEPVTTPFRSTSTSSSVARPKAKTTQPDRSKEGPSWFQRTNASLRSFWKDHGDLILNVLKALLLGALLGGALIFLKSKGPALIPHRKGITCTAQNATICDEMIPVIDAVREYLAVRAGEVDCGTGLKRDAFVSKPEIGKFLDERGFKFEAGVDERWNALVTYIWEKPEDDLLVFDHRNNLVSDNVTQALKLKSEHAIRPMVCRLRKSFHSTLQHLAWVVLGTLGFLSIIWFFKRRINQRRDKENAYKAFVDQILQMLENQYEDHLRDSANVQPWLAISHVRDMLIPVADRKKMKEIWQRAQKQISESESRVRAETQVIHGEEFDVWRWIQPKSSSSPSSPRQKRAESPKSSNEESYVFMPTDVGLTECLKLRNFFDPDHEIDDDEIDLVVDSIQNRCATVRRIEHIGIHANFVYLKFSSNEAAAQGFHLLNNWRYNGREIVAKYLRLSRYYDHFPEARDTGSPNN